MNRTFVLIRLSLKQLIWQMARTFGGRKKFSSLLVLLAAAMLIGLSGLYSWAMIESVPAALNMLIPLSMLSAAFGLILVFGFYHAQGYLFDFQDYDLLASMPLTRRQILMSKLVALVAMMLIYSAFLTLPMMALFQLRYAMPATFLLYGLIGQLFLPIVPMSVACLAAVVVRLVSSHVKHPVLIRNVLSLGMVIGLMTVMTLFQGQAGQAQDIAALIQPIQTWLAPVYWLTMAMINGNLAELLKLIALSSLVLILFLILIAPVWNALNQKARTTPAKAGGKVKLEVSSMNAALLRKELRRYFGSTSLVMNTMVGPVMVALCAVMLAAQKDLMVQIMLESGVDFRAFADHGDIDLTGRQAFLDHAVAADSGQPLSGREAGVEPDAQRAGQLAEHSDPELCLSFRAGHNRAFIGADPVDGAVLRLVWADRQPAFSAV